MVGVESIPIELLLSALAGGAFGAVIGGIPAFTLTGLLVVAGELYALVGRSVEGVPAFDLTGTVAFGPVFGPHVSFAGAAAGVAYAAKRGYLDGEFDYHPAKAVGRGLGARWDVLAVGAVFGLVGQVVALAAGARGLAIPLDPVALGIVVSALAHRLAFGYSLLGRFDGPILDMSPFERGDVATDGGYTVEPWLPHQYQWGNVAALGLVAGALGGYVAYVTASPFLAFGLSAVVLVYDSAGVPEIPVTHHIVLPAGTGVLALAGGSVSRLTHESVAAALSLPTALAVGAALGLLGALLGELAQRVCYAHAETHLDPPAVSIVLTSLLLGVGALLGVVPDAVWIPQP